MRSTRPRAWRRWAHLYWVAVLVLIPIGGAFSLHTLKHYSEDRTAAIGDLDTLASDLNSATAGLGWAVALHLKRSDVEPTLVARTQAVEADIRQVRSDGISSSGILTALDSASAFIRSLEGALILLDAGSGDLGSVVRTQAAAQASAQHDTVIAAATTAEDALTADAERAQLWSEIGIWVITLGSAAVVIAVFWRGERRRRRSAVGHAERTSLAASERRFRLLFERNPLPMWTMDARTWSFLTVNDAAVTCYGYSREEFLAMTVGDTCEIDDAGVGAESVLRLALPGTSAIRQRLKNGRVIDVETVADELTLDGHAVILVSARDVTDERRFELELRARAFRDELTGLPNRALFVDRFEHAQAVRGRERRGLGVTILDVDAFKSINDTLGHVVGDELLRAIGARMTEMVRPNDTVARLGGDEFAVLIDGADDATTLMLAARLAVALRDPFDLRDCTVEITVSAGVALIDSADMTWETALQCADVAMYEAKAAGKACVRRYQPEMQSRVLRRLEIASELPMAVSRGELVLHYQPITPTHPDPGAVDHVEALVRWQHPVRGMISPLDFIPAAEDSGAIVAIGAWVLRTACVQVGQWRREGRHVRVSVNVSGRQLREAEFVAMVIDTLYDTACAPADLVLEITETALLEDMATAREKLARLRALGIRIALDDFGAGYSSLAYLSELPVDTVKIDRQFVVGLDDPQKRATMLTIVRLLETMGVGTVAEGVETETQLAYVTSLGIDTYQGFYFARPLPAPDVLTALASLRTAAEAVPAA